MEQLIVVCPHCSDQVIIEELNCCIFRHGINKNTLEQINPHALKEECDYLFENNLIYGCGKPFKIVDKKAVVCDYI
jgi:hypothetical protein